MIPGFGSLTSLTGGGGLSTSATSGANGDTSQEQQTSTATGNITVGGLALNPKSDNGQLLIQGGALLGLGLLAVYAIKQL